MKLICLKFLSIRQKFGHEKVNKKFSNEFNCLKIEKFSSDINF